MSCHNIGRGMNEVVRVVFWLYDKGEINEHAARAITATCAKAVNWCDGNSGEAIDYIYECRCGRCLSMVPKGEGLYPVLDIPEHKIIWEVLDEENLVTDRLCTTCFDLVVEKYYDEIESGQAARQLIEKYNERSPEEFISTGEYAARNNGCRWVRKPDWFEHVS